MSSGIKFLIALGVVLLIPFTYWLLCLNHVGVNEIGIVYDSISGDVTIQEQSGWYRTSPFVRVAHVTTLPMIVTIPSDAVVINSKVVRFRKEGAVEYVRQQGFSYTMGSNLNNVLLGYAFSGNEYPFLEIRQGVSAEAVASKDK